MGEVYLVELVRKDFTSKPYMINFKEFFIPQKDPVIKYLGYRREFIQKYLKNKSLEETLGDAVDQTLVKAQETILKLNPKNVNDKWPHFFKEGSIEKIDFGKKMMGVYEDFPDRSSEWREIFDLLEDVKTKRDIYLSNLKNSYLNPFFVKTLGIRFERLRKEFLSGNPSVGTKKINRSFLEYYQNYISTKFGKSSFKE